jgi:GxxExxY protein
MNQKELKINEITEKIIGCAHKVSNNLGCGFLEKVYENALIIELKKAGLEVKQQDPIEIFYGNNLVGEYLADILVENKVIIELKVVKKFDEIHFAQCINYLKATDLKVCLLINFDKTKVQIKRIVNNF